LWLVVVEEVQGMLEEVEPADIEHLFQVEQN
jgi:hypothetical protein